MQQTFVVGFWSVVLKTLDHFKRNTKQKQYKAKLKAIQSIGKDARMRAICSIQYETNLSRQVHEKAFRWSLVSVALKIQIH